MGIFDSSISDHSLQSGTKETGAILPDMSNLTAAENKLNSITNSSSILHDIEIGGITTAAGGLTGGALGAGFGLAAEATVQLYKYPLAAGLSMFGAPQMASDLMKMESRYLSTASHFGARGFLVGAAVGAAAYAAYEIKNQFEK